MRVAADGYIDLRDGRKVRTPGAYDDPGVEPVSEGEALAYLLSHSFPGHRRVVRAPSLSERKRIRLAMWADSVSERMGIVDRVWRAITEATAAPPDYGQPYLIQVLQFEDWAYPLYLDGAVTRVIPHGGVPLEVSDEHYLRLDRKTA